MVSLTSTLLIQLIAAGTIPLVFIALAASRMSRQKSLRTKQFKMIVILSLTPALVVIALEGALSGWMTLGGIGLIAVIALIVRERE